MESEKRLIDANALLESFGEEPDVWCDTDAEIQARDDWHRYWAIVKCQPIVDAVEVVHGRWVRRIVDISVPYHWKLECSNCDFDICGLGSELLFKYCPNCGAKMDGDGNG